MRVLVTLVALAALACEHTLPFGAPDLEPLGPITSTLPRPLTLNRGDDRHPGVTGGTLLYSRWAGDPANRDRCIAFLPAAGGTISRTLCPPTAADTFVHTWSEPVLSPDGRRIAFVWQKSPPAAAFPGETDVIVAQADDPYAVALRWPAARVLADGRTTTGAIELSWAGDDRLLFLAGFEYVFKVKGGGADRLTDTTFMPYALFALDVASGTAGVVPGADSAVAYARAPDGGLWLVRSADSALLLHVPAGGGTPAPVGAFSAPVTDLANVDGMALAALADAAVDVEWLEPVSGTRDRVRLAGPVRRVTAVPGGREFIAEIERSTAEFGDRANLWRARIP